jgi:hypothetical protein
MAIHPDRLIVATGQASGLVSSMNSILLMPSVTDEFRTLTTGKRGSCDAAELSCTTRRRSALHLVVLCCAVLQVASLAPQVVQAGAAVPAGGSMPPPVAATAAKGQADIGAEAYVCVWDTRAPGGATLARLRFPEQDGQSARMVVALGFSGGEGRRLVVVTGDNRHTVHVFDWRSRALLSTGVGQNGQPPAVSVGPVCW